MTYLCHDIINSHANCLLCALKRKVTKFRKYQLLCILLPINILYEGVFEVVVPKRFFLISRKQSIVTTYVKKGGIIITSHALTVLYELNY